MFRAIDWYLISNESAVHVGIILTQAALERLASQVLCRSKERGENTGEFIRCAFQELNLDTQIPDCCNELKDFQQTHNCEDGLHALVKLRNDLIHANVKHHPDVFPPTYLEAWNLGQWFIEMLLLKIIKYQGKCYNRLSTMYNHEESIITVSPN